MRFLEHTNSHPTQTLSDALFSNRRALFSNRRAREQAAGRTLMAKFIYHRAQCIE